MNTNTQTINYPELLIAFETFFQATLLIWALLMLALVISNFLSHRKIVKLSNEIASRKRKHTPYSHSSSNQ